MKYNIFRFCIKQVRNLKYRKVKQDFILSDDDVIQKKGEQINEEIFCGGPVQKFSLIGRLYLITLLKLGLTPDSKVLDIGCGALRGGYWLIHFLNPGGYFGIEPNKEMVDTGKKILMEEEILKLKAPSFEHNTEFNFSVFNQKFDFMIARSIWTHTSKVQIQKMLDEFAGNSAPNAQFITSYLKPYFSSQDYKGDEWVGKSDNSNEAGVVFHSFSWIQRECEKRSLKVEELRFDYVDQIWLRIYW